MIIVVKVNPSNDIKLKIKLKEEIEKQRNNVETIKKKKNSLFKLLDSKFE